MSRGLDKTNLTEIGLALLKAALQDLPSVCAAVAAVAAEADVSEITLLKA